MGTGITVVGTASSLPPGFQYVANVGTELELRRPLSRRYRPTLTGAGLAVEIICVGGSGGAPDSNDDCTASLPPAPPPIAVPHTLPAQSSAIPLPVCATLLLTEFHIPLTHTPPEQQNHNTTQHNTQLPSREPDRHNLTLSASKSGPNPTLPYFVRGRTPFTTIRGIIAPEQESFTMCIFCGFVPRFVRMCSKLIDVPRVTNFSQAALLPLPSLATKRQSLSKVETLKPSLSRRRRSSPFVPMSSLELSSFSLFQS